MGIHLATFNGDRRMVLGNGEAIRKPIYTSYTSIAGSANASTDEITSVAHGLFNGQIVLILGPTPPSGLTAGSRYYVVSSTADTFKLALTAGGAAIDLTSNGTTWTWTKASWNSLRIGLRCSFENVTSSIVSPSMAVGVCKGNTHGYGVNTTEHAVGWTMLVSTLAYNAGPPAYLNSGSSNWLPMRKILSTVSFGGNNFATAYFSASTAVRNLFMLDITKNPQTSFTVCLTVPLSQAVAQSDLTDLEFASFMDLPLGYSNTAAGNVKNGYGICFAGAAPNGVVGTEVEGILDHIFVYWNKTLQRFSFDIEHKMLA